MTGLREGEDAHTESSGPSSTCFQGRLSGTTLSSAMSMLNRSKSKIYGRDDKNQASFFLSRWLLPDHPSFPQSLTLVIGHSGKKWRENTDSTLTSGS
jgi:hypothetical protein